jgi:hypothetical protein
MCSKHGNFTLVRNGICVKCDTCGSTTGGSCERHIVVGFALSRPSSVFSCPFRWLSDVHWKDFLLGGQNAYPSHKGDKASSETAGLSLR